MLTDFTAEYSQRTDDEILQLSSERKTLTAEAAAALDAEIRRRNLTEADQIDHQKFIKQQDRRAWRRHRRKVWGPYEERLGWLKLLCLFGVMILIMAVYFNLPSRYQLRPDWQEAAAMVMISSVCIIFYVNNGWKRFVFWISLAISSSLHLWFAHAVVRRNPNLSRGAGKGATVIGLVIFASIYFGIRYLYRNWYGEEESAK